MGVIRFAVYPASLVDDWPEAYRGFLTGSDGRVFTTRIELEDIFVSCRRNSSESCMFHVPWPVPGFGRPVVTTASLPERAEAYLLAVELARGKLVQVRNQVSTWELAGMRIPPEFTDPSRMAHRLFARAASSQGNPEESTRLANESLHFSFTAAHVLSRAYAAQALLGRRQRFGSLPAAIGCELYGPPPDEAETELFKAAFNSATISLSWRDIEGTEGNYRWETADRQLEWCESQRMLIRGGPLIDLGPGGLPPWLAKWEHDPLAMQGFVNDFVSTAMSRYAGRVRIWDVVARLNSGGALTLDEESRLKLAASVLEVARQVDEESQLLVRIDQPWGDYQARGQHRLSPLQVVDALIRSGVGLSGVNLELAMGYLPRGSTSRDLLEISRLIDTWSVLGIPLTATLACPSNIDDDPLSGSDWEVEPRMWEQPCDEAGQAEWVDRATELLLAKPSIAAVILAHFSDAVPHRFPWAGQLRADSTPKPVIERIISRRQ